MSNRITVSARLTPKGAAVTAVTKIRASVDWVYPKAYAYLDEDPKNIKPGDETILADLAALLVIKGFADETLIDDFKAIDFSGTLEDMSFISDAALIQFTLLRHYYDEVFATDDSFLDLGLGKFETLSVPDLFVLAHHLPKYEEVFVTDLYEPHFYHPVSESITLEGLSTTLGNVVFNAIAYGSRPGAERASLLAIKSLVSQIGVSGDVFDRVVQYIRQYHSDVAPIDAVDHVDTLKVLGTTTTVLDAARAGLLLVRFYFDEARVTVPNVPLNSSAFNTYPINGAQSLDVVYLHPNKHLFDQADPNDLFDRVVQYIREFSGDSVSLGDSVDRFFVNKGINDPFAMIDNIIAGMVVERSFSDGVFVNPRDTPLNSIVLNFAPLGANIGGDRISIHIKTITFSSQFNGHAINANALNGNQFIPS